MKHRKNIMNNTIKLFVFFSIVITLGFLNTECLNSQSTVLTGKVVYLSFEGGFFGILGDDGVHYEPMNLSPEYKKENLKIKFTAKVRDDIMSTKQWGTIVDIQDVSILEKPNSSDEADYDIYEWGVMIGCTTDNTFFATGRPEEIIAVKQPVIYIHSRDKKPFGLKVTFANGTPLDTYPEAVKSDNTIEWKNVQFEKFDKGIEKSYPKKTLKSLTEIIDVLNNVDADEINYEGNSAKFLFYEGETKFTNNVGVSYDKYTNKAIITNGSDYTIYKAVFTSNRGDFIHPDYVCGFVDSIEAGKTIEVEANSTKDQIWAEDLTNLGFDKKEAESFSKLWQGPFMESSNTSGWGNLIYRLPEEQLNELIKLDFNPAPQKAVRVMYILVHLFDTDKK
jgi:hypothetical protein